jgi:hypothetical protein
MVDERENICDERQLLGWTLVDAGQEFRQPAPEHFLVVGGHLPLCQRPISEVTDELWQQFAGQTSCGSSSPVRG